MGKIVVTGGAGFIGSHIADGLASQGDQIIILDNLSTGKTENIQHLVAGKRAEFIHGDILNLPLLQKIFEGVEYVFHEAAIPGVPQSVDNPAASNETNVTGTLNVLIAARDNKVKKVIFASSCAVYGNDPTLPKNECSVIDLSSPYAATKLAAEYYCQVFNRVYGLATASLRYFNVYGPRQNIKSEYAAVVPKFIEQIQEGKNPRIFGDGEQSRDFVYVKDVVAANLVIAKSNAVGVFNIGYGEKVSLNNLVETLGSLLDREDISPQYLEQRPGDIKHSCSDISKARKAGYTPRYGLMTGLKDMLSKVSPTEKDKTNTLIEKRDSNN